MVTDYDCWKDNEELVTWELVMRRMEANADKVKRLLLAVIPRIDFTNCLCRQVIGKVKV